MTPVTGKQPDERERGARNVKVVPLEHRTDAAAAWKEALKQAARDFDAALGTGDAADDSPLFTTSGADLLDMHFPSPSYLVRELLPAEGVFVVSAEAKSIKTWATMELAFAIASGTPAFNRFAPTVEPSHVALFQPEDAARASRAKIRALAAARGMTPTQTREAAGRLHFANLKRINVGNPAHVARFIASVREIKPRPALVIVDPLVKVHTLDEDKAREMEVITGTLHAIARVIGVPIQLAHHNGKMGESTRGRRGGQRMRGSGALHGAVDAGLYFDAPKGDRVTTWIVAASVEVKGARAASPFVLTLTVGRDDEHGEALEAAWTVEEAEARNGPVATATREAEALAAVREALAALRATSSATTWHAIDTVRERAGRGKGPTTNALLTLKQRGEVERSTNKGWRLRVRRADSADSADSVRAVRADSVDSPHVVGSPSPAGPAVSSALSPPRVHPTAAPIHPALPHVSAEVLATRKADAS